MDRDSREWHEILLENFYNQIHLTVIYEPDFIKRLGSYAALLDYRDTILDNINEKRRYLGRI